MNEDVDLEAVALASRLREVIRALPPGTQPLTIITALCAVLGRCIASLRPEDRGAAFKLAIDLTSLQSGVEQGKPH